MKRDDDFLLEAAVDAHYCDFMVAECRGLIHNETHLPSFSVHKIEHASFRQFFQPAPADILFHKTGTYEPDISKRSLLHMGFSQVLSS